MKATHRSTPASLQAHSDTIRPMVKLTRLKLLRERKALTQDDLAARSGVSRITIARLETDAAEPRPSTTQKLARALGVEPEDLMEPLRASDV